ncbi:MAG: Mlc titration factor MtfA (ptsG expression regulator) [Verrucomicrobiales bacterium]
MPLIPIILIVCLFLGVTAWLVTRPARLRKQRADLMAKPIPKEWNGYLNKRMAWYSRLPAEIRSQLLQHAQVLIAENQWETCGGLEEVTDEMVVLVSVQAALLLVGRDDHGFFPLLRSVLIYPSAYTDSGQRTFDLREDQDRHRLGESWTSGSVVLAWDEVLRGAAGAHDGTNLVLHEFAHQLDQADGSSDGAPVLDDLEGYDDWQRVFREHYEELVEDVNEDRPALMDDYGAENPAEFFAVATETFFERPQRMKREAADLYEELRDFYGLDPAAW